MSKHKVLKQASGVLQAAKADIKQHISRKGCTVLNLYNKRVTCLLCDDGAVTINGINIDKTSINDVYELAQIADKLNEL